MAGGDRLLLMAVVGRGEPAGHHSTWEQGGGRRRKKKEEEGEGRRKGEKG